MRTHREETSEDKVIFRCTIMNEDDKILLTSHSLKGSHTIRDLVMTVAGALDKNVSDILLTLDAVVPHMGEVQTSKSPPSGAVEASAKTNNLLLHQSGVFLKKDFFVDGNAMEHDPDQGVSRLRRPALYR